MARRGGCDASIAIKRPRNTTKRQQYAQGTRPRVEGRPGVSQFVRALCRSPYEYHVPAVQFVGTADGERQSYRTWEHGSIGSKGVDVSWAAWIRVEAAGAEAHGDTKLKSRRSESEVEWL